MTRAPGPGEAPFDPGLQVERTLLAWRRTCLAFAVAGVVAMRFTVPVMGAIAVVIGLLVAGGAVLAYVLAAQGYARAHRGLVSAEHLARSGLPMLLATLAVLLLGVICALYVGADLVRA